MITTTRAEALPALRSAVRMSNATELRYDEAGGALWVSSVDPMQGVDVVVEAKCSRPMDLIVDGRLLGGWLAKCDGEELALERTDNDLVARCGDASLRIQAMEAAVPVPTIGDRDAYFHLDAEQRALVRALAKWDGCTDLRCELRATGVRVWIAGRIGVAYVDAEGEVGGNVPEQWGMEPRVLDHIDEARVAIHDPWVRLHCGSATWRYPTLRSDWARDAYIEVFTHDPVITWECDRATLASALGRAAALPHKLPRTQLQGMDGELSIGAKDDGNNRLRTWDTVPYQGDDFAWLVNGRKLLGLVAAWPDATMRFSRAAAKAEPFNYPMVASCDIVTAGMTGLTHW
jgi:hypothetical protein